MRKLRFREVICLKSHSKKVTWSRVHTLISILYCGGYSPGQWGWGLSSPPAPAPESRSCPEEEGPGLCWAGSGPWLLWAHQR